MRGEEDGRRMVEASAGGEEADAAGAVSAEARRRWREEEASAPASQVNAEPI